MFMKRSSSTFAPRMADTPFEPARQIETTEETVFSRAAKAAACVLIAGATVALFLFAYVFYFYAWTRERSFNSLSAAVLYYGVPAGLAGLLFSALALGRRAKINLALVCVSLFSSLYSAEFLLRVLRPAYFEPAYPVMVNIQRAPDKAAQAAKLGKRYNVSIDARTGREIVGVLRTQGFEAVPIMSPRALRIGGGELIPLGAIANKLTVLCNESGSWVTYESDEHGFNNPRHVWQSNVEIAAMGDSFAHGYCVPREQSFVGLLRQRYPAILNLGMAGNGPLLDLAGLTEYLPTFKPKVVLWFYFENDLLDLLNEKRSKLLTRYLESGFRQNLLGKQNDIDRALMQDVEREKALEAAEPLKKEREKTDAAAAVMDFAKLNAVRGTLNLVDGTAREEIQAAAELHGPVMDALREILSGAKNRVEGWGGKLYFIYLSGNDKYIDESRKERGRILQLVAALNIPLIDMAPVFQAEADPLSVFPFRGPGHYNEKGHRLVAERVLSVLSSQ